MPPIINFLEPIPLSGSFLPPSTGPICYPSYITTPLGRGFHHPPGITLPCKSLPPGAQHHRLVIRPAPYTGCIASEGTGKEGFLRAGTKEQRFTSHRESPSARILPSSLEETTRTKILTLRRGFHQIWQGHIMSSHQSRPRDQRVSRETGFSLETPESWTFGRRRGQDRKGGEILDIGLPPLGWLQRHCPLGCVVVLTNTKTMCHVYRQPRGCYTELFNRTAESRASLHNRTRNVSHVQGPYIDCQCQRR